MTPPAAGHGTETGEEWDKDQKLGPGLEDRDIDTDSGGEPTTKPGASDETPGQAQGG